MLYHLTADDGRVGQIASRDEFIVEATEEFKHYVGRYAPEALRAAQRKGFSWQLISVATRLTPVLQ